MKTMFENMISLIVMMIFVFIFTGIITIETQVINARNIHARVMDLYQSSNHILSESYFNNSLSNGHVSINSINDKETEIIYSYDISVPFINSIDEYRVVGYTK